MMGMNRSARPERGTGRAGGPGFSRGALLSLFDKSVT